MLGAMDIKVLCSPDQTLPWGSILGDEEKAVKLTGSAWNEARPIRGAGIAVLLKAKTVIASS